MKTLEKKQILNLRYLCGTPELARNRYNELKRSFPSDEHFLFAEPVYFAETNTMVWTTSIDGNAMEFTKLTDEDKSLVKNLLRKKINKIISAAKKYEDSQLLEFVFNCIEVPSMANVYLLRGSNDDAVVLTFWGFVSDEPDSQRGLLAKIIEVKKIHVNIQTIYEDNKEPASKQKLTFVYEDRIEQLTTDNNGIVEVQDVPVDVKFYVIYEFKGEKKEYSFYSYEQGRYVIEVPRILQPKFKVVYKDGTPVPGAKFIFEYEGNKIEKLSDKQGFIVVENIYPNTEIVVYQVNEEGEKINTYNFLIDEDKTIRFLYIEQKIYTMRIKVVDKRDRPIVNADVFIEYSGKKELYHTDNEGFIYVSGIEPGTKVKVRAVVKNKTNRNE